MGRQLAAEPAALATVSALLAALALAPGLPAAPFAALSAAAAGGAVHLARRRDRHAAPAETSAAAVDPFAAPAPVVLELAEDLLASARAHDGRTMREALAALREQLWRELGVQVPGVVLRPAPLSPGTWALVVDDVPIASGRAPRGELLALVAPGELALVGIGATAASDPVTGRPASLVAEADGARAAVLGPVLAQVERVVAEAGSALRAAAHQLVGVQEAQALLDALEPTAPALVREASRQLPPALLAEVLRRLVEEGVSIRPLRTILEAMLEAGGPARGAAWLAEACRRALRRHIAHRFGRGSPLAALLVDPTVEHAIREALAGEALALEPGAARALLDSLEAETRSAVEPPVILAAADVRRALRGLVAPRFPRVAVLTYEELPPDLPVRPVGRLAIAA
jgi:type III secretion protein V